MVKLSAAAVRKSTSSSGRAPLRTKLRACVLRKTATRVRDLHFLKAVACVCSFFHPPAGNGAIPFNTQFFHDDFDDGPGFDDVYDGDLPPGADAADAGQEEDLLAATQGQTRRIRPQAVNYSKRAKRVDVRKLKENIWKSLDIVVAHENKDEDEDEDEMQVRSLSFGFSSMHRH